MFGFFSKKTIDNQPAQNIAFHPNLIEELSQEHRQLFALYDEIKSQFNQGNVKQVAKLLHDLGILLRAHLLKENMHLYIYLNQLMIGDHENSQLVRSFHREMDDIVRPAVRFLEKYDNIHQFADEDMSFFISELDHIFATVRTRMQREEHSLYPLYQQKKAQAH